MTAQTTAELIQYYSSLLIKQYQKPKAIATVEAVVTGVLMPQVSTQQMSFSSTPTDGSFSLSYNGNSTADLAYNASDTEIQTALQALPGLSAVSVANGLVTFTGVTPPALPLGVTSSSLVSGSNSVSIGITETDLILPLAVQNAYNILGSNPAVGVQLDVIGTYAGVTRNGVGVNGQPITLNDTDFLTLIQIAIIRNNNGSSLYDINTELYQFFGTQILCTDNSNMTLTYLVSSLVSSNLIQLFITENLLPAPMAVGVSIIIYAPIVNAFFGFVNYDNPVQPMITRPFNTYDDYNTNWPWFSYNDVLDI